MADARLTGAAPSGCRAVAFDALGTLVELESPWPLLRSKLADRHGIEVSEAEARHAMLAEMTYYRAHHLEGSDGPALAELRERCAVVLGENLPAAATLPVDQLTEALLDSLRFTPYPDAAPALAALRAAGLRLAVVSNWDCSLRSILADLGLAAAVDVVVVSAEVGAPKPEPAIFRAASDALRREPRETLFVGDSLETDVCGALEAGMRALLLDRSGSGADRVTGEPAEVRDVREAVAGEHEPAAAGLPDGAGRVFSLHELAELVEAAAIG